MKGLDPVAPNEQNTSENVTQTPLPPSEPSPIFANPLPGPPEPNHHKKRALIIIAIAVLLGLIGVIIFVLTKTPLKNSVPFLAYNSMLDVTPEKELTVGDNRYVGACQALPVETVEEAVKPLEERSSYIERYYAQPPSKEDIDGLRGANTSCHYIYLDEDNTSLVLDLDQYSSTTEAKKGWDTQRKLGNGEYRKEFLQSMAGGDGSALDEAFKSIVSEQDVAELEASRGGVPLDGLDSSILFVAGDGSLVSYRKNIKITLKYEFGGKDSFDGTSHMNKQEAEAKTSHLQKIFADIFKNIDNPKLSQAPQRSIPGGQKEIYGSRVIEPCGLLSADIFKTATSKAANDSSETSSTTKSLTRTGKNSRGQVLYPHSDCNRSFTGPMPERGINRDRADMDITLVYAPSPEKAKAYVEQEIDNNFAPDLDLTKSPKELGLDLVLAKPQTAADFTYVFDTSRLREIKPDMLLTKKAYFTVDSYVVIMGIDMESADRTPKEYTASDDAYTAAIESITKKLRSIN